MPHEDQISPLRRYRHKQGKTLREMAVDLGVSEGQLSRIETFGTTSLSRALALSTATGLPPEAFLRAGAAA